MMVKQKQKDEKKMAKIKVKIWQKNSKNRSEKIVKRW